MFFSSPQLGKIQKRGIPPSFVVSRVGVRGRGKRNPRPRGFLWDPKPVSLASKKWVLSNPEPRHPPHPALRATFPSRGRLWAVGDAGPYKSAPLREDKKTGRKIPSCFFIELFSACPCRRRRSAVPSCPPPRRRYPSARTRSSPWAGPPGYGSGCRSRR